MRFSGKRKSSDAKNGEDLLLTMMGIIPQTGTLLSH